MTVALRACSVLIGLCVGLSVASMAQAIDLGAVEAHLRERGASNVSEVARGFLFEGEASAHAQRLQREGCVAYLALGTGEVRDVDLSLYTRAGQLVAEDAGVAPFAYARVCGARGLDLYASATMYAGRGELVLLRVEHAPRELGRLPSTIPFAVSAGGRLEELRAIGVAADELSPEGTLLQEERAQATLGYVTSGPPQALELRAGSARGQIVLRAGRCYRVMGVVPFSRGVAIEIESGAGQRWFTRSAGEDRTALALCATTDASYAVRVQARPLRGLALLRVFEHKAAEATLARDSGDATALAIAEAKHVAAQRGLSLQQLGNAWIESSSPLVWPVTIDKPGCYAFAAVSEVGSAAVDVRLTDARGTLIAHNEGRRGVPMVFTCAREAGPVRLVLKARGPDLRVSLWRGQSDEARR
ncbi:MAG: hypothetical protein JWN48_791 [Myxococcaceae bacterium]|nr:hypothetical protein [Myxococcaceae bacterium]